MNPSLLAKIGSHQTLSSPTKQLSVIKLEYDKKSDFDRCNRCITAVTLHMNLKARAKLGGRGFSHNPLSYGVAMEGLRKRRKIALASAPVPLS